MGLLGAVVGDITKLAGAIGSTLMTTNQTRSIVTQTKVISMTEKRDSDNRQLGLQRMEFDAKMEMVRQAVRAKERDEDRQYSLSLKKIEADALIKNEKMRQAFQSLEAEKQGDFTQSIEKFKTEVQIALQSDNIAFQRWKSETEREFTLALRELDALIVRQRHKQNRDDARRDRNSPVFSVADDILAMVLNREQMPLTIFFSPPVLRYHSAPNSSPQSQFPMMESTLLGALRDLFKQYSLAKRQIKFMAGEWITKNRRAEEAVYQIYADLKEIPVIVLESEVEESYLNINIGFWNNDFDDARFERVVRKLRWQNAIGEISQRLLSQWQAEGKETTVTTPNGKQTHPEFIRRNREEFIHYMEVLHCIHVGMVADEYFLLYAPQRQLPLLPTLLPDLLEEVNLLEEERTALIHVVIDYANAGFDSLAKIEPATIVDVRLAWAKILQKLSDRYTFADQVQATMTAWLKQRGITNSTEPVKDISSVLIPEDASFVQVLNPLLASLELPTLNIAVSCFQRGLSHLEQGQWQLARLDFDRTISLNPHANAYFQRGYACLRLEDYANSIKDFDQAAMLNAQRAEIYEYLGNAYLGLIDDDKRFEKALANYNQSAHLGSTNAATKRDKLQAWLKSEAHQQQLEKEAKDRTEAERKRLEAERRKALIFELPNNGGTIEFVWIRAGKLIMEGNHEISLPEFRMSKYPIIQRQYQAIIKNNPSNFTSNYTGENGKPCLALDRPVENVYWKDAKAFCEAVNQLAVFRDAKLKVWLPSETQWEYACRDGAEPHQKTKFWFGNNDSELKNHAWHNSNSNSMTHSVKEREDKQANKNASTNFGLVDMHGNVWEWCADNWTSISNLPKDGKPYTSEGDSGSHAVRGGAWISIAEGCASACRYNDYADYRYNSLGFRVVLVES